MKNLVKLVPVVLLTAAIFAPYPVAAKPASVVATIHGGGTSQMDEGAPLSGISAFGIVAKLLSNGSATGHFDCVDLVGGTFPGNFFGEFTSWSQNPDGSVNLSGIGKVIGIPGGPIASNFPFTVTIQQFGGAGVGHWTLDIPLFGGIICIETLVTGQIVLN